MAINKSVSVNCVSNEPQAVLAAGGAFAGADTTASRFVIGNAIVEKYHNGALDDDDSTIDAIVLDANCTTGMQISVDSDDDFGCEFGFGVSTAPERIGAYKIGTDPAFFVEAKFGIPTVSQWEIAGVGFRKAAAFSAITDEGAALGTAVVYTDFAYLYSNAGDIFTSMAINQTGGGTGTTTPVDSTANWAADAVHTLRVNVDAAGLCSFLVDGVVQGTVSAVTTFDDTDVVIPSILFLKVGAGAVTENPIIEYIRTGHQ